jgi:hypothetical protein
MGLERVWLPVGGYEERYEVSNLGEVRSIRTNKILSSESTKDGYLRVRLWNGEKYTSRMIHCLVAEAFIPVPNTGHQYEVDHIDNNVSHNAVNNLQWLTHKDNLEKSFQLNHQTKPRKKVYQYTKDKQLVATYNSVNDAFRATNIRHISECANGIRKTAGGYVWSYILFNNIGE